MITEKQISNFRIHLKKIIGKGSYGTVYLGQDIRNGQKVALKVIPNSNNQNQQNQTMIQKEIEIMKKFNHQNIVQLFDVLETINNKYIVTEYCNGPDLRQYLEQVGSLTESDAIKVLRDIVQGLYEIQSQGIIHRDLKPANVIKHDDGYKITDFGFSRTINPSEMMKSLVGTPLYMAPQILMYQNYTDKCDIWSLGLLYYEMIFGITPWVASSIPELVERIQKYPIIFEQSRAISLKSINFIQGCLQIEESKRFSWKEVFEHDLIKTQNNVNIIQNVQKSELFIFTDSMAKKNIAEKIKLQKIQALDDDNNLNKNLNLNNINDNDKNKNKINNNNNNNNNNVNNNNNNQNIEHLPKIKTQRERTFSNYQLLAIPSPNHLMGPKLKQFPLKSVTPTQIKEESTSSQSTCSTIQQKDSKMQNNVMKQGNQSICQRQKQSEEGDLKKHIISRPVFDKNFFIPDQLNKCKSKQNLERMRRTKSQLDNYIPATQTTINEIDVTKLRTNKAQSKHIRSINNIFATQLNQEQIMTNRQKRFCSALIGGSNIKFDQGKQKEILLQLLKHMENMLQGTNNRSELKHLIITHREILIEMRGNIQLQYWIDGKRCIIETLKELKGQQKKEKDAKLIILLSAYIQVVRANIEQQDNQKICLDRNLLQEINEIITFCSKECDCNIKKPPKSKI